MAHLGTVGTATASTSATAVAVVTSAVPAGATVLLAVAWESSAAAVPTITSVVDSRGNSWPTTPDVTAGGSNNSTVALVILRCRLTTALQNGDTITVTISLPSRSRWAMQADAFDDIEVSPLDGTATTGNTAPGGSSLSTGATGTLAQPYELAYAAFAFGGGRTPTIPAGWSGGAKVESTAGSADRALQVIWKYTDTTAAVTGTLTLSSSSTHAAAMGTYRAASGDPPTVDVTRLQMQIPAGAEGPPPVVDVTGLRMQLPAGQGAAGEVHVSRLRMRLPAAPGQAPYSGIKARTAGGSLRDVAIYVAE